MKKLILTALLLIAPIINAQYGRLTGGLAYPKASIWDDSLHTLWIADTVFVIVEGDTISSSIDSTAARTTVYVPLNFEYEWVSLTAIDTGTTYDDSVKVWGVYYEIKPNLRGVEDTLQTFPSFFFKDSTNTQLTTQLLPVDDASIHTYSLFAGALGGLILELSNVEAVNNRVWYFKLQAIKK